MEGVPPARFEGYSMGHKGAMPTIAKIFCFFKDIGVAWKGLKYRCGMERIKV